MITGVASLRTFHVSTAFLLEDEGVLGRKGGREGEREVLPSGCLKLGVIVMGIFLSRI